MEGISELVGMDSVLNIANLAKILGKAEEDLELPGGRKVKTIAWKGSDLVKIHDLMHNQSAKLPALVKVNGSAPAWLVTALVHECHPMTVAVNSQQGYVTVACQLPKGTGAGMKGWAITQKDDWTQVEFSLDGELSPGQLVSVVPPEVPMGTKIIVSGRGPLWLAAAVAMAYHGVAKAVACLQPKVGATVCITHTKEITLGTVIPE
jgi:CRISPR-associated Csx3 family protein